MTVGKLVEQLQKCDPKARAVVGTFTANSDVMFVVRSDKSPDLVVMECEDDIDVGSEISARYEALYEGLREVGFTVEQVEDTMGINAAELYRQWMFED